MNATTTICCSAVALILSAIGVAGDQAAPSKDAAAPLALVPTRAIWTLALNNQLTAPPAYDDARAYFSIEQDRLVSYDIISGKQLWLVEAKPAFQPAAGNGFVFFAEPGRLVALNATDGLPAWEFATPEPLAMRPVWDNGWLIAVTASGSVLALRAEDGRAVWTSSVGDPPSAAPSLAADRVYIPTAKGRIVALNVADGSPVWERRIGGAPNEILARDDRLFVGSTDNYLYCLLAKDGRIDWRWRTGADVIGAPVADEHRVYFVSLDNVLRGMSATSGAQQWLRALPMRPIAGPQISGTTILVVGQSPAIRAFNSKDGSPAADIPAGDEVAAAPHLLQDPARRLPMVLFVTKHIARGASAALHIRSIEPPVIPAIVPLPNPIMPVPTPATR